MPLKPVSSYDSFDSLGTLISIDLNSDHGDDEVKSPTCCFFSKGARQANNTKVVSQVFDLLNHLETEMNHFYGEWFKGINSTFLGYYTLTLDEYELREDDFAVPFLDRLKPVSLAHYDTKRPENRGKTPQQYIDKLMLRYIESPEIAMSHKIPSANPDDNARSIAIELLLGAHYFHIMYQIAQLRNTLNVWENATGLYNKTTVGELVGEECLTLSKYIGNIARMGEQARKTVQILTANKDKSFSAVNTALGKFYYPDDASYIGQFQCKEFKKLFNHGQKQMKNLASKALSHYNKLNKNTNRNRGKTPVAEVKFPMLKMA